MGGGRERIAFRLEIGDEIGIDSLEKEIIDSCI